MPTDNNPIKTKEIANTELLPLVTELLDQGHTVTLPLRGYSMRPFLEDKRDKALLRSAKNKDFIEGDIVLAQIRPKTWVLHRIIRIDKATVTLRGDGNLSNETCSKEDVKAIAIGFYRKGRPKPESTASLKWRMYSKIWSTLYPIRRYLLYLYRKLYHQSI